MFFDGLVNSSIARNLANGDGSFWSLHYSKIFDLPFCDQLPLTFGIQALFFKVFGDHLFVERLYSFIAAVTSGFLIIKIWNFIYKDRPQFSKFGWLPVLFWIITPVVFWSYSNNMLENTVTVFDLAAVLLLLNAIHLNKINYRKLLLGGLFILAAVFSKGPVGLYPLATLFIYQFSFGKISFSKSVKLSLFVIVSIVLILTIVFAVEQNARQFVSRYFDQQVFSSIAGQRENAPGRLFIVGRLMGELVPLIILSLIIFLAGKNNIGGNEADSLNRKNFMFFFLMALSASLPITISLKQSGYYLVPSFPMYALAAGVLIVSSLHNLIQNLKMDDKKIQRITIISFLFLFSVLAYSFLQIGKVRKDREMIMAIHEIGNRIPRNSSVSICRELYVDWNLHAYLMRYFYITLDDKAQNTFYLVGKNCQKSLIHDYEKIPTENKLYEVYKHK